MSNTSDEVGHTLELPWGYDGEDTVASHDWDGDGYSIFPVNKDGDCIGWIADVTDEEKAAFIVRACNFHDSLVKALENAESALRYCEQNLLSPNDILRPKVEVTIKSIAAALSQAKGGK